MFLKEAIEKFLNDPKIGRRENAELKKACEGALGNAYNHNIHVVLDQLNAEIERRPARSSSAADILPNRDNFILADPYFLPFELACKSPTVDIVINALNSIAVSFNSLSLIAI
jgi:brefeldin A-inhibited guanine nucleotide-exchange protein